MSKFQKLTELKRGEIAFELYIYTWSIFNNIKSFTLISGDTFTGIAASKIFSNFLLKCTKVTTFFFLSICYLPSSWLDCCCTASERKSLRKIVKSRILEYDIHLDTTLELRPPMKTCSIKIRKSWERKWNSGTTDILTPGIHSCMWFYMAE